MRTMVQAIMDFLTQNPRGVRAYVNKQYLVKALNRADRYLRNNGGIPPAHIREKLTLYGDLQRAARGRR